MIKDLFQDNKTVFSLEVFPPKRTDDISLIYEALDQMKELNPDFISVTYGAGGGTSKDTISIASYIQNTCNIEALAHLTCAALTPELLKEFMDNLEDKKIQNVLALRGDQPKEMTLEEFNNRTYHHASDLTKIIKQQSNICVAGACYPEKHPEAETLSSDIMHVKKKVDNGADFLITQLFFDNECFYRYEEMIRNAKISIPITVGLMPITTAGQIKNIIQLSGARIPKPLSALIDKYKDNPEDLKKAGLDYVTCQALDLINHQVNGIHLYTMNKVDVSRTIFHNLSR